MTGPTLSAEATSKDEVLKLTTSIQIPSITGLVSYDISFADAMAKKYALAVRDASAVAIVNTTDNSIKLSDAVFAGVAGGGPNGVWFVNHTEIWAGDGDSTVKILDLNGKFITSIPTGGAFRVDEGCFDPDDELVAAANNNEVPWPWINLISTKTRTVVKKIVLDGLPAGSANVMATGGIEQCKWDRKTGKIYVNVPEVNGSGPGVILVIDPKENEHREEIFPQGRGLRRTKRYGDRS
jgi:hypothetical protein